MSLKKAESAGLSLLKRLNISIKKDEPVRSLSGGMKRKVSLAIALIGDPKVSSQAPDENIQYNLLHQIIIMINIPLYHFGIILFPNFRFKTE